MTSGWHLLGEGSITAGTLETSDWMPCWQLWEYDRELYRQRNLIERAFNRLKHWRRVATRYDRRSLYFLSVLYLVSSVIWG